MEQTQEVLQWRSTSFSVLLSQPKYALDVYNALNGSSYDNPEDIKIIKVESGISLSVQNDATFVLFSFLNLYEHQSTPNPNMPLRFLIYVSKIYKQLANSKNIYGTAQIYIPEPNFVVFYNGSKEDYYPEAAIRKAIKECIRENILAEFFKEYGEMIVSADVWDCTFEKQIEMERRDFYAAGVSDGISQGEDRMRKLIKLLIKDGRDTEIPKASENTSYYENLLKEYNIQ